VTQLPSGFLRRGITLIDSPGVLSGEKQRVDRGYDFPAVTQHLAERADRILLLFDCSKLDISDEFKDVVRSLDMQHDKVRCLLNKADLVEPDELFRVYGALLWSLGKVVDSPEVPRVFVTSMREGPYRSSADPSNFGLFDRERAALLHELHDLPRDGLVRRINETAKRWRAVRTHATLCSALASQFGVIGFREKRQAQLLEELEQTYFSLAKQHQLNAADFPNPHRFRRLVASLGTKMWHWQPISDEELSAVDREVCERVRALLDVASAQGLGGDVPAEGEGRGGADGAGRDEHLAAASGLGSGRSTSA